MNPGTLSGLLQLLSAAVTPVVMISACAALILGVNNKHSGLSDRLRSIATEYRQPGAPETRRQQIRDQIPVFHQRFLYTWIALWTLYGAVITFTLTVLLIVLTQTRVLTSANGTLSLFILGVVLMLVAAGMEIAEIALAHRSLRIEIRDIPQLPQESRK
jgi:hypothetical protein